MLVWFLFYFGGLEREKAPPDISRRSKHFADMGLTKQRIGGSNPVSLDSQPDVFGLNRFSADITNTIVKRREEFAQKKPVEKTFVHTLKQTKKICILKITVHLCTV